MPGDSLSGLFKATLTGRVFLICREENLLDQQKILQHEQSILKRLETLSAEGGSMTDIQHRMSEELDKLRKILRGEIEPEDEPELLEVDDIEGSAEVDLDNLDLEKMFSDTTELDDEEQEQSDDLSGDPVKEVKKPKKPEKSSGYKPAAMDMHEKLEVQRKPVAELLKVDCVNAGLLSSKRAEHWVHNMSGRVKEEVETEIVGEIAQSLHDKVKNYIRSNKGDNPWSTPQLQDDLRADIMAVKTVRGILLLFAQITAEVDRHEAGKKPGIMKRLWKKSTL
jgi:hypothetical protein